MKGILDWARAKVESIKTGVQQSYHYLASTVDSITSIPYVRNFAYSFSIKFWVGLTRPIDPNNVTKLFHSEKTRRALRESVKANLLYYLSYAVALELLREQLVKAVETNDDESWFTAANTINMLYGMTLGAIMVHRTVDNVFINMTLAKYVVEENELAPHFRHCGDDDGALISAGIFSAGNTAFKKLTIGALSYVPVIGWIAPFARMHTVGESLAEYPYSFAGMCTAHRAEALVRDNAYSLGIGVMSKVISLPASLAMSYSMSLLVYKLTGLDGCFTGVSSYFIDDALQSFLNTYLIVSVLLQDKPIPGDKNGIDFFYYHRFILQSAAKTVGGWIDVSQQGNTTKWNWRKRFETINEFQFMQHARRGFQFDLSYGDWKTLKTVVANPSITLFLNEYLPLIARQLDSIINMRDKSLIGKIVPILPGWFITFMKSEGYNKLIKIIFDERLDQVFKGVQALIREIDKLLEAANTKVIFQNKNNYKGVIGNLQLDYKKPDEKPENLSLPQLQDDQFFDLKEQKDVAVNEEIQEQKKESLVKSESTEALPVTTALKASGAGFFSEAVSKSNSAPELKPVQRKKSHRSYTSFITDDYVPPNDHAELKMSI